MPRGARLVFENSFYHVFNRGANKQSIFLDRQDYLFFIKKLRCLKQKYDYSIYAYCLMPNHYHLSIRTRKISISKIIAALATSYAVYFNHRYHRSGPIFQNRFKSILIENDSYFLQLARYIYLNPVRAKLIKNPLMYPYSGLKEALKKSPLTILDADIIRLIGESFTSIKQFEEFVSAGMKEETDIGLLFHEEESVFGTSHFATIAKRKYVRHKKKGLSRLS